MLAEMDLDTGMGIRTEVSGTGERPTLVSVRGLRVWFDLRRGAFSRAGQVHAVDGVTFDLAQGEAIAIVGESGCGKSTLMKTILGLYQPTGGEVDFEGEPVGSMGRAGLKHYRSQIGYVQQDPFGALAPFMTVQNLLREPLAINQVPAEEYDSRIRRVMEEVKLAPVEDFVGKFPHQLSGGQLQRVVIARAMILQPKMIVADEPVSMLDASVRVEILKLLRSLQEEYHLSVMYITHDLSTVRYFSERIFVMYAGWLVEKAPVNALLYRPKHPYTEALLSSVPRPDPTIEKHRIMLEGEVPSPARPPSGCHFHPRCRYAEAICSAEVPRLREIGPGHMVACHRAEELTLSGVALA